MESSSCRVLRPAIILALASTLLAAPLRAQSSSTESTREALPAVREAPVREAPIQNLGQATVLLDGPWAFHPGDDFTWADSAYDDSAWARIETGRDWESQGFPNLTGFAWYRRHISLTGPTILPDLSLILSGVDDAAEVYWNGQLVGATGKLPPRPVWYNPIAFGQSQLFWPHVIPLSASATTGVLAIRVWKSPHLFYSFPNEGGLLATPLIGGPEAATGVVTAAHFAWLESSLYDMVLAIVSGLVAVLAFLAWMRNRRQRMLLWLAVFTAHPLLLFPIVGMPWLLSFRAGYGLIAPVVGLQDVSLWFLLLYLLGLRENARLVRWTKVLALICMLFNCLDASVQLFDWTTWPSSLTLALDITFTIPALLLQAYSVVLVAFALRKRLDASRWFLAITAMLADLDFAFSNWFSLGVRWTHITWYTVFSAPLFSIAGNGFDPVTILDTVLLAAILFAVWQYEAEQRLRQSALDEEYRNAQELQQVLIPESLPDLPGYAVTSGYRPAQEVGGDFFQLLLLPQGQALAVVGDVSGKGLKAAMTVSLIVGAVRSLAESTCDPAAILAGLNRRLFGRLQTGFATCIAVRLDADGHCLIANAGHLAPFLNGQEFALPPALPLGLTDEAAYDTTSLHLEAGDRLTLYTDGLPEARSATGELYGFDRLRDLMAGHPDAPQAIEAAISFGQEDDVTVLTLTRALATEPSIATLAAAAN